MTAILHIWYYGVRSIDPQKLVVGDTIHQWSPTGGHWKVTSVTESGVKLCSDMGATRNKTWAQIAAHGITYLRTSDHERAS